MQRGQPFISAGAAAAVTFSSDNTDASEWQYEREASSPFVGIQVGHTRRDIGVGEDGELMSGNLKADHPTTGDLD